MSSRKTRVGLLLASLSTGSGSQLMTQFAREAGARSLCFFVFPGGRLGFEGGGEYRRNAVYRLANSLNLDGLISWGSSIGGAVPRAELDAFHYRFDSLPYVTIAHKMAGRPCVSFNAYSGMQKLVRHFVFVHRTSRIAFLRGPVLHGSAEERYHAFLDVMQTVGESMEGSPLITDPVGWGEGERAALQLCRERGLVPGRDFDVLIGASDLMTLAALRALEDLGYRAPDNFYCAGFNDSPESLAAQTSFSTVHLPYRRLAGESLRLLDRLIAGKQTGRDVCLDTELVIRESCGCSVDEEVKLFFDKFPRNEKELAGFISQLFRLQRSIRDEIAVPLARFLISGDEKGFEDLIEESLPQFFAEGRDIRELFRVAAVIKRLSFLDSTRLSALENRFFSAVSRVQHKAARSLLAQQRREHELLNALKYGLLAERSLDGICSLLKKSLQGLGIGQGALVLAGGSHSHCIPLLPQAEETDFPRERLLPEGIEGFDSGAFVVEPLCTADDYFGYLVLEAPVFNGSLFEDLSSFVSRSLSGVLCIRQHEPHANTAGHKAVFFVGSPPADFPLWAPDDRSLILADYGEFEEALRERSPSLVVLGMENLSLAPSVRENPVSAFTPICVLGESFENEAELKKLLTLPRLIICNTCMARTKEFAGRLERALYEDDILPPDTGALVKKAIIYINRHVSDRLPRWKIADAVCVSEDYLSRIFHREMGLAPWDYVSRVRINLAARLLLRTNATMYDIAEKCGFQDQAYFCRVFKKTYGVPPVKYRLAREV